jgi:Raf kinase inhibitor-like YbhB/YbcL family protein
MTPTIFTLDSPAFAPGEEMPVQYTCEGDNISPALVWHSPPEGTKSLALLVDDPDAPDPAAPTRIVVHWLLYNIDPRLHTLPEKAGSNDEQYGNGALNVRNKRGYTGPCPPIGRHRYFFNLYALDAKLPDLGAEAGRVEMERALEGHVIGTATLMGTYIKAANR